MSETRDKNEIKFFQFKAENAGNSLLLASFSTQDWKILAIFSHGFTSYKGLSRLRGH